MRLLLATLLLALTLTVSAQTDSISVTKIDGTVITNNVIELDGIVKSIKALKKLHLKGQLSGPDYEAKVAILIGDMFKK